MIKAIIFDVGGVIVGRILRNMARDLSEKYSKDFSFFNKAIHKGWNDYKLSKITADEFWRIFIEGAKIDENIEDLKKMSLGYIDEIRGTVEVINSLKKRYRLAILSNNADEWVEKERKMVDFDRLFDVVLFSNEVKLAKPHKEFFMLCAEKLGLKPEECLFVDDQNNNLGAAKNFGFKTLKFENAEQLKKDLRNIGVKID